MLVFLPLITFAVIFLNLNGRHQSQRPSIEDWRSAFIKAAILLGVLIVLITESLSLLNAINQFWLGLSWMFVAALNIWLGWRYRWLHDGWRDFIEGFRSLQRVEAILIGAILVIVGLLFTIAIVSPPNNVDAQVYHLPRVAQWVQNQSLRHFPTTQHGQLIKPLMTELGILTLRVLVGGEKLSNLIQFFSMVGCLIGASIIAKLMKVDRLGQILTAVFVLSIPLGVLQSTNTKNDYVTAFWMVALAYLTVLSKRRDLSRSEIFFVGASLGLGMLTKGTFYIYAFPMLLWLLLPRLKSVGVGRTILQASVIGALAILINLGLWTRNVQTYGGLFGHPGTLRAPLFTDEVFSLLDPSSSNLEDGGQDELPVIKDQDASTGDGVGDVFRLEWIGQVLGVIGERANWLLERTAHNVAQNIVMPELTAPLQQVLYSFPHVFHEDFVDSLGNGLWNHEDTAGNLLHLLLIFAAIVPMSIIAYKDHDFVPLLYAVVILTAYASLSFISYSVALYGVRYQLSFFVLGAPLIGVASTWVGRRRLSIGVTIVLLIYALPYVFLNNMRPIFGWRPRTRIASIFTVSDAEIMFATLPHRRDEYEYAAKLIQASGCKNVGIGIPADAMEYQVWWLLSAPESGIRIESITPILNSKIYADHEFQPCALICIDCQGKELDIGLPLEGDYGHFRFYINP